nr:ribonuclease H-like domain-containing protein [Tanacetum cinerariifolium]
MRDENPIRTLGDYSKPSHEGYRNTIELPVGNNVCSNNIKENLSLKHGLVSKTYSKKSLIMAMIFGSKSKSFMTMSIPSQDEPSINWPVPNLKGFVSNFMASQDARLSNFEADFKQQQGKMTNKIDTVLKIVTDRMARALPSDTVKNPKLNVNSTSAVLSARSYLIKDPQCSTRVHSSINSNTICPKQPHEPQNNEPEEEEREEKYNLENINTNPSSPPDPSVSFITENV